MKFFVLVFLVCPITAYGALNCDTQIINNSGDRITGIFHIKFGDGNINAHTQTDAGEVNIWDPTNPVATPEKPYADINFIAAAPNEVIRTWQTSGPSNGWSCWFDTIAVIPQGRKSVSPDEKRDATVRALWAASISTFGFSVVVPGLCPAAGLVVCTALRATFGGVAIYGTNQGRKAIDPFDPDYLIPFDAEANWDIASYF